MTSNRFSRMDFLTTDGFLKEDKTALPLEDVSKPRHDNVELGTETRGDVSADRKTVSLRHAQKVSRIRQEHPQPLAGNPAYNGNEYEPLEVIESLRTLNKRRGLYERATGELSFSEQHAKRQHDNAIMVAQNVQTAPQERRTGLVPMTIVSSSADTFANPYLYGGVDQDSTSLRSGSHTVTKSSLPTTSRVNKAQESSRVSGVSRQHHHAFHRGRSTRKSVGEHACTQPTRAGRTQTGNTVVRRSCKDYQAQQEPRVVTGPKVDPRLATLNSQETSRPRRLRQDITPCETLVIPRKSVGSSLIAATDPRQLAPRNSMYQHPEYTLAGNVWDKPRRLLKALRHGGKHLKRV
jgi:hypothetical protein